MKAEKSKTFHLQAHSSVAKAAKFGCYTELFSCEQLCKLSAQSTPGTETLF